MNLLIGCHGFPPKQTAGAELRAYRTARRLADRGLSVRVLAVDEAAPGGAPGARLRAEEFDGLRVYRLSYSLGQVAGTPEEYDNPAARQALDDLLAAERPDVLHLISGYRLTGSAILAARARGVPTVVTLTDYWFLCPRIVLRRSTGEVCTVPEDPADCALCLLSERRRYRLPQRATRGASNALLKRAWRGPGLAAFERGRRLSREMTARRRFQAEALAAADQIIAPSHFLAEVFRRRGVGQDRIRVIRQGVGLAPGAPRREGAPGGPLTFGYVGQLAEHKGVDLLVRAFRRLPRRPGAARLLIHGDPAGAWPPYWRKLQQAIGGDSRIVLAGPFANAEAPRVYAGLDVVVMPSRWYENSPNVILEAYACGVPVMAADLGGMAELIDHERNGCLFPANDVQALTGVLRRVVDQPAVLAHWRAAIPAVKTIQQEMDELMEVYHRAIANVPGAAPGAWHPESAS